MFGKDDEKERPSGSGVMLYSPLTQHIETGEHDVKTEENLETLLLNKASSFSCYVTLSNTIMGAGMLGLPYAFSKTGWVLGFLLMVACASSSAFSLHELSICAKLTEKPSSFYAVAMIAAPKWTWLIDAAVAIKCFGVATSYLIIIGDLMPEAVEQMGGSHRLRNRELWIGVAFAIVGPIAFLNSLEKLKWTSTASVFFVSFVAVMIVLFAAHAPGLDPCEGFSDTCVGEKVAFNSKGIEVMEVLSIFVFAFTCHQNTFPVVNELRNPLQSRVNTVFFTAIGTALVIFSAVAFAGFSTYGDLVESNVLKSYPKIPVTTCARIFISFLVAFTYPLQCNPSRRSILNIIRYIDGGREPTPLTFKFRYMVVTVIFLTASFMIAFTLSDLGVMLSIVGATGSTIVSYLLPGGFFYSLHHNDPHTPKWKLYVAMAQVVAGCILIPLCLSFIFIAQASE